MINCSKCGKDNLDHYKFCLDCGAELPQAAAPEAAPPAAASCPQCGEDNAPANKFCAACGFKLAGAGVSSIPAARSAGSGVVLTALNSDGSEAGSYELPSQENVTVGRGAGHIFENDSYLSPRHATIHLRGGQISITDEGSLNGVYVKLDPNVPFPLAPDAVFRIGQEIIRFEPLERKPAVDGVEHFGSPARGIVGRLALVIGRKTTGNAFPIPESGLHLGRERGDVLFGEDGYVSGLHCRVVPSGDGSVELTDVGSSNGTFVRIRDDHPLRSGDILLMGQQVYRLSA